MSRALGCVVTQKGEVGVGGTYKVTQSNGSFVEAKILEFVANEFVKFEWLEFDSQGKLSEETCVRVRTGNWPNGKGFLSLVQNGFSSPESKKEHSQKWADIFDLWQK